MSACLHVVVTIFHGFVARLCPFLLSVWFNFCQFLFTALSFSSQIFCQT